MYYGRGIKERKAATPCKFYIQGSCMMGNACEYSHEEYHNQRGKNKETDKTVERETAKAVERETAKAVRREAARAAEKGGHKGKENREAARAVEKGGHKSNEKWEAAEVAKREATRVAEEEREATRVAEERAERVSEA